MKRISGGVTGVSAVIAFIILTVSTGSAQTYVPGVYYSEQNTNWPPLPLPPPGLSVYSLGDGKYLYDDTAVDYSSSLTPSSSSSFSSFTLTSSDDPSSGYTPFGYTTNDFYIELRGFQTNFVTNVSFFATNTTTNIAVLLRLHGTVSNELYQLESCTNLSIPAKFWTPGEIITGSTNNNYTDFDPVAVYSSGPISPFFVPVQFFRAHHSDVILGVTQSASPAVRPLTVTNTAVNGTFFIQVETSTANAPFTNFPFSYTMSGGAVNGIDYTNIPLSNTITASFMSYTGVPVDIWPTVDNLNRLNVEAVMTLNLGPGYLVSTNNPSALVEVDQDFGAFAPVQIVYTNGTTNLSNIGMAYHPISNNLVLSVFYATGSPFNFAMLDTNVVFTNWSGVARLSDEIDLAIVPTNAAGFNKGDMFYSNGAGGGVGWLSANGTVSNTAWASVAAINPDEFQPEAGFYLDQTGIFSNNLVMGTQNGGIYTIDSGTNITPWAFMTNYDFENVITLPNNTNQYGPWAGKILAGNEPNAFLIPYFVTVDTNRVVNQYNFNIPAEDVHIIPTNQDFYYNDIASQRVMKVPRHWFTNYVGDVVFSVEGINSAPAGLYILHWDAPTGTFIKHILPCSIPSFGTGNELEQGTFAPIDIPASPVPN